MILPWIMFPVKIITNLFTGCQEKLYTFVTTQVLNAFPAHPEDFTTETRRSQRGEGFSGISTFSVVKNLKSDFTELN